MQAGSLFVIVHGACSSCPEQRRAMGAFPLFAVMGRPLTSGLLERFIEAVHLTQDLVLH